MAGEAIADCADVFVAPLGTAAPTTIAGAWPVAFKKLGALQEDSKITRGGMSGDTKQYRDFCKRVLRSKRRGELHTMKFVALENTKLLGDLIYPGSTVTSATGVTTRAISTIKSEDYRVFGWEVRDGTFIDRWIIHKGMVTDVADVDDGTEDLAAYEITVTAHEASGLYITHISNRPEASLDGYAVA